MFTETLCEQVNLSEVQNLFVMEIEILGKEQYYTDTVVVPCLRFSSC